MANIKNIDCPTLKNWLDNKEAVLIDVREKFEFRSCSIQDAINLPLSQVTIDKAHLPEHKNKKLVLHCKSGKRSMMACQKLIDEGIKFDIYNLTDGIESWKNNNFPTNSTNKPFSVARQVQILMAFFILAGLGLYNVLMNSSFLILPLIVGIDLLISALTNWCFLTEIITKMPWNKRK